LGFSSGSSIPNWNGDSSGVLASCVGYLFTEFTTIVCGSAET
jgi:hypothetical protein